MNLEIEKYVIKHFEDRRDRRFLPVELWIVSEGKNRNESAFTFESLVSALDRFKNISLSAKYERSKDDFMGHEVVFKGVDQEGWAEYEYIEVPVGLIPENSKIRIEADKTGKRWIVAEGLIWSERNRKVERLLRKNKINNISMEIKVLDYEMVDKNQIIKDFMPMSVVFLSNTRRTGIANAVGIVKPEDVKTFSDSLVLAFEAGDLGMNDPIKADFKFSSLSNDAWSAVNKDELRKIILGSENFETLVDKCYLLVENDWQDTPADKIGYPVCQFKNGKLVYNRNAILMARQMLERNKGEDYYSGVNAKLIKLEKKIGIWKEYDYAKFEGGVDLDNEKLKGIFLSMFGANLIAFENNMVTYIKRDGNEISFACKNFSIEMEKTEDGEESEKLLVSEEEFACEPKMTMMQKEEVDGEEVTVEKFVCSGEPVKQFVKDAEQLTLEKQTMLEEQNKKNSEFETRIEELNKQYENLVNEKSVLEQKNKNYEEEKFLEKMNVIVKKYEVALGDISSKEWSSKIKTYSSEDALEKDILYSLYSEKPNNEHFKFPAGGNKAEAPKSRNVWEILERNVTK